MTTTTIHDTGESYSSPAWPIRVGGCYQATGSRNQPLGIFFTVTAIDGDTIYYNQSHRAGLMGKELREPYHSDKAEASLFRHITIPADESPCTRLYAALRAVIAETRPYHQDDTAGRPWLAQALQLLDEEEAHTHEHHG